LKDKTNQLPGVVNDWEARDPVLHQHLKGCPQKTEVSSLENGLI
jgi:hypothetical protein